MGTQRLRPGIGRVNSNGANFGRKAARPLPSADAGDTHAGLDYAPAANSICRAASGIQREFTELFFSLYEAERRPFASKYRSSKIRDSCTTCRQLLHPYFAGSCSGCRSAIHVAAWVIDTHPSTANSAAASRSARTIPASDQFTVPSRAMPLTTKSRNASDRANSEASLWLCSIFSAHPRSSSKC